MRFFSSSVCIRFSVIGAAIGFIAFNVKPRLGKVVTNDLLVQQTQDVMGIYLSNRGPAMIVARESELLDPVGSDIRKYARRAHPHPLLSAIHQAVARMFCR
jgi:hypothetical protein